MIYVYNMEPAKLDDRELACIDFFLFCFLLSSGLVWVPSWIILAPSWVILAPSWAHLGPSWTILAPSGAIRAPSCPPKASQSLPRLNQTIPRGAQRLPEPKSHKHAKVTPLQIEILVRNALVSGGLILFGLNVDLRLYSMKTRLLLKKTQKYEHSLGEENDFFH